MGKDSLSAAQRGKIRRISGTEKHPTDEGTGEINVVPFLDIITNVLMFVLATVAITFTATIDTNPPRLSQRSVVPALDLSVLVVNDGFSIKTHGSNVASGCADVGSGLAIPKKNGEYDYDALRTCATKLKSTVAEFKSERQVTVSANPSVPYQVVINTVDAVRKTESGDELFPDIAFSVAR